MEEVWNHQDYSQSWPPGQTEQSGEKGHGQGGNQEPDGHSDRAPEFLCGNGTMRNKILCSDETKIELFGLNAKRHVWGKPGTILMVKHDGGSMMVGYCVLID